MHRRGSASSPRQHLTGQEQSAPSRATGGSGWLPGTAAPLAGLPGIRTGCPGKRRSRHLWKRADVALGNVFWRRAWQCRLGVGPDRPGGVSQAKPGHRPALPGPSRRHSRRRARRSRFPPGGRGRGVIGARPQRRPPANMSPPLFSLPEARLRFTVSLPRLLPASPPSFQPSLRPCRSGRPTGRGCTSAPPGPRPGRGCCRRRPGRSLMELSAAEVRRCGVAVRAGCTPARPGLGDQSPG